MSISSEIGRRRLRTFAFGIALVFGAVALSSWFFGREDLREGSEVVSQGGEPLGITEIPASVRATYRVESGTGEDRTVTTERVWFSRPFRSRIETWSGEPPGDEQLSLRQSAFGILASSSEGTSPLNITVPPGLASGDLRIDNVLERVLEQDTFLRRERREVYGRECQVYRAGESVLAGDLVPYEGGEGNYADLCVDANGIVIEEFWVDGGRPIRRRVATEVEVGAPIDNELFVIQIEGTEGVSRGAVERIDDDVSEEGLTHWVLDEPPEGFEDIGRYAVVLSEQAIPRLSSFATSAAPSSTSDVYVRGPDLLVVNQDPSLAELVTFEERSTTDIEVGDLVDAQLVVDARMNEVRAQTPDGSYVRIFGTLPPDELVALATQLEPQEPS